ncbi:MAG: hypothetical protein CMK38_06985 [Porticoccaceae bacterium]|nr:hypothetical protein [Porticoccaceae bacterium]|tara:strand:+ start:361 stop:609 length:249 start_codon:yes stop_codon:yes gene_type:complete
MRKNRYSIRDVRDKLKLTARTIRYYEEIGLVKDIKRNKAGSRFFNDCHIERLIQIKALKESGLSLKKILKRIENQSTKKKFK